MNMPSTTTVSWALVLSMLVTGSLAGLSGSVPSGTCVCATTNVNGRSLGSLSGEVLATIPENQCGTTLGGNVNNDGYTWYVMQYQGEAMWVVGNYLQTSTSCNIEVYLLGTCLCATSNVNGRSEGSLSGTILTTIPNGQCGAKLNGVDNNNGHTWIEMEYDGQTMWVAGSFLEVSSSCGSCPTIISRSEWSARTPTSITYLSGEVDYAFIHHTASAECHDLEACKSVVRGIQNHHMVSNGWSDIGYSFLVGGDGNVYEGRGWDRVGAHTSGYNSVGLAFSFIGTFTGRTPTADQLQAAQRAIACGVQLDKIKDNYTLKGHKDVGSTSCPGDTLYAIIKGWTNYSS